MALGCFYQLCPCWCGVKQPRSNNPEGFATGWLQELVPSEEDEFTETHRLATRWVGELRLCQSLWLSTN
jgi:hypothetical protein